MARIALVCQDCRHAFAVVTQAGAMSKQKRCPKCASERTRQTLASYLRNGALSDPNCGAPRCSTYG
jgi:DNA replicative helicase MCM subunit Mcm2 (Cdc46/Mcm family)